MGIHEYFSLSLFQSKETKKKEVSHSHLWVFPLTYILSLLSLYLLEGLCLNKRKTRQYVGFKLQYKEENFGSKQGFGSCLLQMSIPVFSI